MRAGYKVEPLSAYLGQPAPPAAPPLDVKLPTPGDLLAAFSKQLSAMKSRTRNDPLISKLQSGLVEIRPLIPTAR